MRKPRDYDSELKALDDKAKQLRQRKLVQLGELVVATGADALPIELLAGALLAAATSSDMIAKEEWRARGSAFFRSTRRVAARSSQSRARSAPPHGSSAQSAAGETGAS